MHHQALDVFQGKIDIAKRKSYSNSEQKQNELNKFIIKPTSNYKGTKPSLEN